MHEKTVTQRTITKKSQSTVSKVDGAIMPGSVATKKSGIPNSVKSSIKENDVKTIRTYDKDSLKKTSDKPITSFSSSSASGNLPSPKTFDVRNSINKINPKAKKITDIAPSGTNQYYQSNYASGLQKTPSTKSQGISALSTDIVEKKFISSSVSTKRESIGTRALDAPDLTSFSYKESTYNASSFVTKLDEAILPYSSRYEFYNQTRTTLVPLIRKTSIPDNNDSNLEQIFLDHLLDTSNPHNVTATQVGKDIAQWNANKLMGYGICTTAPVANQHLVYDGNRWCPSTPINLVDSGLIVDQMLRWDGTTWVPASNSTLSSSGKLKLNTTIDARFAVEAISTTEIPIVVMAISSQTSNLTEWRNSANAVVSSISASGAADLASLTINSAFTFPTSDGTDGQLLKTDGSGNITWYTPIESNAVTSVGLSLPSIFTVSGSPVTSSGTLTATLANQSANTIFASPNGSAGTPGFRTLVKNDLPSAVAYKDTSNDFYGGVQTFTSNGELTTPISVRGHLNQMYNLQDWKNATNTVLAYMSATGKIKVTGLQVSTGAVAGYVLTSDVNGEATWQANTSGTVTSVGLSLPSIFTVSGSPVTSSGTLTATINSQSANTFFAAPNGSAGAPTFRAIVKADLPSSTVYTDKANSFNGGTQTIISNSTTNKPFVVKGIAGQTGNLTEWQNSISTTLAYVSASGSAGFSGLTINSAFSFPTSDGTVGQILKTDGSGNLTWEDDTSGDGTVTSVGLSLPSIFTVSGSPVTSSGTLTGTLASQTANTIFAAPNGADGSPVFRTVVRDDLPAEIAYEDEANIFTGGTQTFVASSSSNIPIVVSGAVSQSANLTEWRNSSGTVISSISSNGRITASNATINGRIQMGTQNVFVGYDAGILSEGFSSSVAIGYQALASNVSAFNQTAIGHGALYSHVSGSGNTAIGHSAQYLNTTGFGNVSVGNFSLYSATGDGNVGLGLYALNNVTTGEKNIAIGHFSGTGITTGSYNVIIGNVSDLAADLENNIIIADGEGNQRINVDGDGAITFNSAFTFPSSDGTVDQILQTDGSGIVSWVDIPSAPVTSVDGQTGAVDLSGVYADITHNHTISDITDFPSNIVYNDQSNNFTSGSQTFVSGNTVVVPVIVKSVASQIENLTEWRNELDVVLSSISPSGGADFASLSVNSSYSFPTSDGTAGQILKTDGSGNITWEDDSDSSGTVTSVGLSLPSIFTVTGSPVTTSGTLTGTLASQSANTVFASPNGSTGTPTFRTLVKADLLSSVVYNDQANTITGGIQTFVSSSAASKIVIVKGAISQSANLQEWQNSSGTSLSSISSTGIANLAGLTINSAFSFPTVDGTANQILQTNGSGAISWVDPPSAPVTSVDGQTGDVDLSGIYEPIFTKNTGFNLNLGTVAGTVAEGDHTHTISDLTDFPSNLVYNDQSNTITGGSQIIISDAITTKPLIVRAIASQTANLTEWQNSSGITLSGVASSGIPFANANIDSCAFFGDITHSNGTHVIAFGTDIELSGSTSAYSSSIVAIGNSLTASATRIDNVVALGRNITWNTNENVLVGYDIVSTDTNGVALGSDLSVGSYGVTLGRNSTNTGRGGIVIGYNADNTYRRSAAIGWNSTTTAEQQFVIGGDDYDGSYRYFYLGKGITSATPEDIRVQATSGLGTDIEGATFNIAAGQGTGSGDGGSVVIQVAPAGSTGSTLNPLRDFVEFDPAGTLIINADTGQTANLTEWRNSSGTVIAYVDSDGSSSFSGSTTVTDLNIAPLGTADNITTTYDSENLTWNGSYWDGDSAENTTGIIKLSTGVTENYFSVTPDDRNAGEYQFYHDELIAPGGVSASSATITNQSSGTMPFLVKGAASQTADLSQWQNSSGTVLVAIDSDGKIEFAGDVTTQMYRSASGIIRVTGSLRADTQVLSNIYKTTDSSKFLLVGSGTDLQIGGSGSSGQYADVIFSNSTNVGIGTSDPLAKLHVESNSGSTTEIARFVGTTSTSDTYLSIGVGYPGSFDDYVLFSRNGTLSASIASGAVFGVHNGMAVVGSDKAIYSTSQGANSITLYDPTADLRISSNEDIKFYPGGTEKARFLANGNLGLGETIPGAKLQVNTVTAATKGVIIKGAASQTANLTEWQNSSGTVVGFVDVTGRAGLGVASTTYHLHVKGSSAHIAYFESMQATCYAWLTNTSTANGFGLTGSKLSVVNSSGIATATFDQTNRRLGIITDSPQATLHVSAATNTRMRVSVDDASSVGIDLYNQGNGSYSASIIYHENTNPLYISNRRGVGATNGNIYFQTQSTTKMTIQGGGNVGIGVTTPDAALEINPNLASTKGLIVQGAASQTANLTEWQNSSGTVLAYVDSDGNFTTGNTITIGSTNNYIDCSSGNLRIHSGDGTMSIQSGSSSLSFNKHVTITNNLAASVAEIIKGAVSQTANLTEWQDSSGTVLAYVDANGKFNKLKQAISTKTADYTVVDSDFMVLVDATTADVNVTLPDPTGLDGQTFVIKRLDSSTNIVEVLPNSTETIDGDSSYPIRAQYIAFSFISDGTNWFVY